MKNICIFICLLISYTMSTAQTFQKTTYGLKTKIRDLDIEVQFFSDNIVRVKKSMAGTVDETSSLSVVKQPEKCKLKISETNDHLAVSSSAIEVRLDLTTAKTSFFNLAGNPLLAEKDNGVQFTPTMDVKEQKYTIRQAFILDKDEAIYGLGQQQNDKLNQRGQTIVLKNQNMKICIPYILSVKGYGVFWDNYASTTFSDNQQETSFESLGKSADYYFMYGKTGNGVVAQMRDLTGAAPMMPLWTYGFWQSRERYKNQQELLDVVDKYRTLKIPLDGIIQDWQYWGKDSSWNAMRFNPSTFPDPKGMVDRVHQQNAHLMIVSWPNFGPKTEQFAEFESKKMLLTLDTWPPKAGTKPYDPYNPVARDIFWNYLNKGVFSLGVDAWWIDCSEPDHLTVHDFDFDQPTFLGSYRSVVNAYPLMHTKGIYEHQRATTSDKRVYILTRSAFAGQQRFAANSWSGDVRTSWGTLRKQIPAALNFSLCGIPYWNSDIGGFFAGDYTKNGGAKNPEFQEIYVRWAQFACFTPMMRSHGTDIPREIYQFGERGSWAFDAIERSINLRYSLLPYLYSTAWEVTNESGSFMNALPMEFAADKKVLNTTDEYLFGRSFLVAPVVNPMYVSRNDDRAVIDFSAPKSRPIYLPKGADWFDFWTGEKLQGGQEISRKAPIDLIPLYVKSGTILPIGPKVQYATEKKWDNLEIRVYPGSDGQFTLYEDENDNYNYEKGMYSTIKFVWDDKTKALTIEERQGRFSGMMDKRHFNVLLVSATQGLGDKAAEKFDRIVVYNGKKLAVNLK